MKISNNNEVIGSNIAIELIYDSSLRFAKYYIKDEKLAEDILHNVFEKILTSKSYNIFDSLKKFEAFVGTSVKNRFIDHKRKLDRTPVERFDRETFDLILNYTDSGVSTDKLFEDNYKELEARINKCKLISSKSHLSCLQYLVVTLRQNDYSFNDIVDITGDSLNTVLGQMRYGKIAIGKTFYENRIKQKRRRRFREGRDGRFGYEKLLLKLPPYQYFVIKMKSTSSSITFKEIAKLENVSTSTVYYRFLWAKKNLKKMVKTEDDYKKIINYIDSLNNNVGGKNWHKDKFKNSGSLK